MAIPLQFARAGKRKAVDPPQDEQSPLAAPYSRRKRRNIESNDYSDSDESVASSPRQQRRIATKAFGHIQVDGPAFPRSAYQGYDPPLPPSEESSVLFDFSVSDEYRTIKATSGYAHLVLEDFSIYMPRCVRHTDELVSLDRLQNSRGNTELCFDGVLSVGNESHYLQGVRFNTMAVEGYGDPDIARLKDHICIQSKDARSSGVWYKLGQPSAEYARFYRPFLWLAMFTKHFVEYLLETRNVTLDHFRRTFYAWLITRKRSLDFEKWHGECGNRRDFRTTVAANVGYLWKECHGIDDEESGLDDHSVWTEVDPQRLKGIPQQPNKEHRTICTTLVHDAFRRMYFSRWLKLRATSPSIQNTISFRKRALGLTPLQTASPANASILTPISLQDRASSEEPVLDVRAGDVVTLKADTTGPWRIHSSQSYAYVQGTRRSEFKYNRGQKVLDVLWLYRPWDTTVGAAYYPFKNELFMSDHCECRRHAVDISCVTGKADVIWFASDPSAVPAQTLFVRQKFRTKHQEDTYDFVSLKRADFACSCAHRISTFETCRRQYVIGDPVLVRAFDRDLQDEVLEPAQVVDFNLDLSRVMLRRLRRRQAIDQDARPNELELTDEIFDVGPSRVIRKCNIKFFGEDAVAEGLPTPYNRGGAGDFYYIVGQQNKSGLGEDGEMEDNVLLPPLESGLDLSSPPPFQKLTGMGIFCGGGNFDRGLEDGGAVKFKYAVDYAERAIYSYRANVPDDVQCFYGSVNDYLARAMAGEEAPVIAGVGDVDFLSGGSPCPGFSRMQPDHQSEDSLRNASLVASFISYVDFYSPRYCMLENVVPMTQGMGPRRDENVFAQALAALVAMGYQVRQFLMDAWSYGSSQSRTRVFIAASAPGHEPLPPPPHTHYHPNPEVQTHSLGRSSNGKPFGNRRDDYTPFQHVSIEASTADLPDIGDSQVQLCPAFPDHRVASEQNAERRGLFAMIPKRPYGMGVVQAARQGLLSGVPMDYYNKRTALHNLKEIPKTFSRLDPNKLCQTVTTTQHLACLYQGRTLHWSQDRPMSVMELRRAQGFPDEDVILGTPRQQVVIIGNSVERNTALALGLALRESWTNSYEGSMARMRIVGDRGDDGSEDGALNDYSDDGGIPETPETTPIYESETRAGAPSRRSLHVTAMSDASTPDTMEGISEFERMAVAKAQNAGAKAARQSGAQQQATPPSEEEDDDDCIVVSSRRNTDTPESEEVGDGVVRGRQKVVSRKAYVLID
ncbi:uncharacterized protein LTR77_005938 [Saxophila tyrrhenica]|uniref:DNA (cytosine-5-)-methyltransferase n=1 Tax=Saxophila tyrrhenica TaxID=1690608 RepID=A0AAV9P6G0_9PEZI|nr:hypothetical protein LTR77_005938 [Saxophila tyrrhenica]